MIRHKHSIVIYEENYNVTKNVGLFQTTIARQNQHYHGTKKSSNDNNSNVRNNNMMQIRKYTGTNDKYRKYQYTKIKGIKTIQKSSTFSSHNNNSSVVSPFSMKQNKLHSITHNPHSCTYENNKSNTTIIQHKKT